MVAALLGLLFFQADADASRPVLTTVLAVRTLSPGAAAVKRRVKLTGIVTHATPQIPDCFLQDDTAGIYVSASPLLAGLSAGDRLELEGVSDPGTFAPMVVPTAVRKLGRAALPDPEPYDLKPQDARWLDGQYVQVYAHVRALGSLGPFTTLAIVTSAGAGELRIPGQHADAVRGFVGRTVRVRGVCVPKHDKRQTLGPVRIYVQSPASLRVIPGPPRPETAALIAEYVKGYSAFPHPSARPVILAGAVTARVDPNHFFLQDESGGVLVSTSEATDVKIGRRVQADGFLEVEGPRLLLRQARVKLLGETALPPPLSLKTPVFDQHSFGRLVRVEGVVEEGVHRNSIFLINLRDGPVHFQAVLETALAPKELSNLEVGTRVAVVGVAHWQKTASTGELREPRLFLRSASDVTVLALPPQPPWWTTERVVYLVLAFAGIVALGGLWVWLLRRQVRKQTAVITANFEREAQLSESLRQARKLEAVGRLTAGIAHDFNNLLTVILGNSEMLIHQVAHDPIARDMATMSCEAGRRAADLTRQLLTFSRQTPVHLEPLDLNTVVHDAERLLGRLVGAQVRLAIACAADLPRVRGDAILLHQVILNLALNARDAMPHGGDLTLRTSLEKSGQGAAVVRLTVTDNGCGMDDETRAHIFEPFFTTKEVGKGTGLGLATVYGAIATLHGAIQVQSAPNLGTTFRIDLAPVPSPDGGIAPPHAPARLRETVILLVDDEESIRKVGISALERFGYTILSAGSPVEALELARARPGVLELLVSDLIMPGMNGREMAALMRVSQPSLRVLFMTGYPPEEVARIVGDLPDVDIMAKPFTPTELAAKVQDILEEGRCPQRTSGNQTQAR